jgi:capsular exopolysaccharide synthesis family protein
MIVETPSNKSLNDSDMHMQEGANYMKLLFQMLTNWPWFILALSIALLAAWFYINNTFPTWQITATVLIDSDNPERSIIESDPMLRGFGLRPGMQNLDNQINILTSRSLIDQTLNDLSFDIDYYQKGLINKISLYPESPIQVYAGINGRIPIDVEFKLKPKGENVYNLSAKDKNGFKLKTRAELGDIVEYDEGNMLIEKTSTDLIRENGDRTICFIHHSREKLVQDYRERLIATTNSRDGTIINLRLEGTNKEKDLVFLSRLTDNFIGNNLERKNQEAERTISFIDEQLMGVTDSLAITEDKLQEFRSRNMVMDVSVQGEQIIDQAMNLENERARLVIEKNYYEYLDGYLSQEISKDLPVSPATIGITDPGLANLVLAVAELQSQYYSKSLGEKNPMQSQIAQQLRNTRDALIETLKGVRHANDLALKENAQQIRSVNAKAAKLPRTERELLGIQREFKINDELHSYLLQKKAEAQIRKASNSPDNEIIDSAGSDIDPVAPSTAKIYLLAFFFGLGIPFLVIFTSQVLGNVIKNEDDLKRITNLPIAGRIPHSKNRLQKAVLDEPFSPLAESFRALRAKIQFFTQGIKSPIILITSSMPDEGKTFTAINLASVYSMMGKKTLLVGFDLRRPVIFSDLNIADEKGLTTWYIDGELEIIEQSSHLDILPTGPKPPNPAELITSAATGALLNKLREKYDFIILDSAPIGTVSDSIALAQLADATILIVRYGKTIAPLLAHTIADVKANGIKGISLLLNDIKYGKIRSRYYGTYRYNNKYFTETKKSSKIPGSWFQKNVAP